ncbi:MAG TPA: APC family permease [Candidatus Acidoferrales bacterium]|nr:APC family permease [Candidatus Acidoferrales bacterium]
MISVAGTAPANTIATSMSTLIAAVGFSGPGALLFGAIPMFGIALAYFYLNSWRSDAGAAYAWVGSAVSPLLGFFAGWAMLVAQVLFMVVGSLPVADATLDLVAPALRHNVALVTAIGLVWFLLVVGMVLLGIRATAHIQRIITYIQIIGLAVFGIGALAKGFAHPVNAPSLAWLSPSGGRGLHGFVAGALVTMFFYWGWEVSANLSEETVDRNRAPGLSGLIGMGIILALFVITALGVQLRMSAGEIADSGSDLLVGLANTVVPRPWGDIAIIVVIISAVGSLETSLVSGSRLIYSMGRDEVLDPRLGRLNPRFLTPWNATFAMGLVSMALFGFAATSASVNQILSDSINAIGVEVAIFYGLSAVACAVHYRRLWPIAPALFVFGVALGQVLTAGPRANATVLGLLLAGLIPLIAYRRAYNSSYYRQRAV